MTTNVLKSYPVAALAAGAAGTAYTVPASTTATVIGFSIANNSSTAVISVNVQLKRGATSYNWVPPGANIPVGGSLQVVGVEGKMVLAPGDLLTVTPVGGTVDTIVSVLEQS
jgi:hypothetical protein